MSQKILTAKEFFEQDEEKASHPKGWKTAGAVGAAALAAAIAMPALGLGKGVSGGDHYKPNADQRAAEARAEAAQSMPQPHPAGKVTVTIGNTPETSTIWASAQGLVDKGEIKPADLPIYVGDAVTARGSEVVVPGDQVEIEVDQLPTPSK